MSEISLTRDEDRDFALIERAMQGSGRGRRFLAEHARRCRSDETAMLLRSIARLENAVVPGVGLGGRETARSPSGEARALMHAIGRLRSELAGTESAPTDPHSGPTASEALGAIVLEAELTAARVTRAAEAVQEVAWTLREVGSDAAACAVLDRQAADLYATGAAQAVTARRTDHLVRTLRSLEERIAAMAEAEGALGHATTTVGDEPRFGACTEATGTPHAGTGLDRAFRDLDTLSIEEKIALFS